MFLASAAPLPTLLVIPTGIGCRIGGFAGDGLPSARLLAAASGCLISHPNVLNGAALYWSDPRFHYVEGWALNRFARGELALAPVRRQRVGLLLDAGIEPDLRLRHLQVADACRATLGLSIGPVVITDQPVEVALTRGASGASWGQLGHPETLLRGAERLCREGATAIAVVTRFPDEAGSEALQAYRQGSGVDALAGAEAVISHLLGWRLGLPCAHAPALAPLPPEPELDPRAAAEELAHTFLACVLVGLSRAPNLIRLGSAFAAAAAPVDSADLLHPSRIGAVVAPAGALGGEAVLSCAERGIPLIVVEGNPSLLSVTAEALGLEALAVASYAEAAGLVLALREGLAPESLSRPLVPLRPLEAG
ncbi:MULTISPECIES: DUF3326 domain-containing protein [unclassified Synechococcus]|uniref:DUF3326 domain-containing protein n=1 Tax=unclassified Synechococcus TaxID=2626047 RepID=UPI0021A25C0E|nr:MULTISPECIES: DUF3326 domain-containing protein [unclassified Synechococcus]MCT0212309.1 DUF3326 domain-containing protein [Synechococcus sp. CS-1326]MCT0234278.1 DUF3326 domain-containing protein [Synechococcus sp. CS-1327]